MRQDRNSYDKHHLFSGGTSCGAFGNRVVVLTVFSCARRCWWANAVGTFGWHSRRTTTGRRPGNSVPAPDRTQRQQPTFPDLEQRPIYISGNVRLADGTNPPDHVIIERVCQGVVRPEAYTDSKGNFSFQLGARNSGVFYDASVGGFDPLSSSGTGGLNSQSGVNERD